MTVAPIQPSPAELVEKLVTACQEAGMQARRTSPNTVWVNQQHGSPRMAETVRLMPDESGQQWWHYSWGAPICKAEKIRTATEMINKITQVCA